MFRRRPPFQRVVGRGITVSLSADERQLVRRLLGEVRELLSEAPVGDPKMLRLFPPAYSDDDDANADYARLMHDELVASRLAAIERVDGLLVDDQRTTIPDDEVHAFAMALNSVRLVLGTLLDVGEDDDDPAADDPHAAESALYNFLSWLVDSAVAALMAAD